MQVLFDTWAGIRPDRDLTNPQHWYLDREEFTRLVEALTLRWKAKDVWPEALLLQRKRNLEERVSRHSAFTAPEGKVSFGSFTELYNLRMGAARRRSRIVVKRKFEGLQTSRHGLNEREMQRLLRQVSHLLMLLPPKPDWETEWFEMRVRSTGIAISSVFSQSKDETLRAGIATAKGTIDTTPSKAVLAPAAHLGLGDSGKPTRTTSQSIQTKPNDEPRCSFEAFEKWWRYRMGLSVHSLPVLPEFFSYKLAGLRAINRPLRPTAQPRLRDLQLDQRDLNDDGDAAAAAAAAAKRVDGGSGDGGIDYHGGKEEQVARQGALLWQLAQQRVGLINKMAKDWGELGDMYGHVNSLFTKSAGESARCIISDDTLFSASWDICQVLFLFYVSLMVPMRACLDVVIKPLSGAWLLDTVVDVYFIVDLVLNFFRSYDEWGVTITKHSLIARNYLQTWFVIDLIACLPVQYIGLAVEGQGDTAGSNLSIVKTLRLLRLSKMLRLARIKRILAKYDNSMLVQSYAHAGLLGFTILFTAHVLTCIWYLSGTLTTVRGDDVTRGWVLEEWSELIQNASKRGDLAATWAPGEPEEWYSAQASYVSREVSVTERYISSMYYVMNSLEAGYTDLERMVAVFAHFLMMMVEGLVAGVLSAMMIAINGAEHEVNDMLKLARAWMSENQIPKERSKHALMYLKSVLKSRQIYQSDGVVDSMPPNMRREFFVIMYERTLEQVPLFRRLPRQVWARSAVAAVLPSPHCLLIRASSESVQVIAAICEVVRPIIAIKSQVVIEEGSVGRELYVLISGELEISRCVRPALSLSLSLCVCVCVCVCVWS
jgi:hypothetical protein